MAQQVLWCLAAALSWVDTLSAAARRTQTYEAAHGCQRWPIVLCDAMRHSGGATCIAQEHFNAVKVA